MFRPGDIVVLAHFEDEASIIKAESYTGGIRFSRNGIENVRIIKKETHHEPLLCMTCRYNN